MIFTPENSSDVVKYFRGSYVKFPETGDYLCTVDQVEDSRIFGKIFSPDEHGVWDARPFQQPLFGGIEIDFVMPKKGFFNYNGAAHLLTRIPARQYRKGICGDNTCVNYLCANGAWKATHVSNFQMLTAYVNKKQYLPFDKHEDLVSYAVAPRMAVTKKGYIMVDKSLIGHYNHKKGTITARNDSFAEEIFKVVKSHGQEVPVAVGQLPKSEDETSNVGPPVVDHPAPGVLGESSFNEMFKSFINNVQV